MKLLILNWRDLRSPRAGGAELLTHEIAKRLVVRGHEVTWFTSRPDGLAAEEEIDGVRIVRRGSELTTRLHAPSFARRGTFDVVVEQINTLPYFAPLWSRAPTRRAPQSARPRGLVVRGAEAARSDWLGERARLPAGLPPDAGDRDFRVDAPRICAALACARGST